MEFDFREFDDISQSPNCTSVSDHYQSSAAPQQSIVVSPLQLDVMKKFGFKRIKLLFLKEFSTCVNPHEFDQCQPSIFGFRFYHKY